MPKEWLSQLSSAEGGPSFRVEELVKQQLGFVPDFLFMEK